MSQTRGDPVGKKQGPRIFSVSLWTKGKWAQGKMPALGAGLVRMGALCPWPSAPAIGRLLLWSHESRFRALTEGVVEMPRLKWLSLG